MPGVFGRTIMRSVLLSDRRLHLPRMMSMNVTKPPVAEKIATLVSLYEDFVGLSAVKMAQGRVLEAENTFVNMQEQRRERQQQIQHVHAKLKEIHLEIDKTSRGEDRYLNLITQEHSVIKDEKRLMDEFKMYEKAERDHFTHLSNAVRDSHEKERAYAEKTKYWSIIGSVCGAVIGIVGTTVNNWLRMRELRGIVQDSSEAVPKVQLLMTEMSETMQSHRRLMSIFIDDLKGMLGTGDSKVKSSSLFGGSGTADQNKDTEKRTEEILALVKKQDESLVNEMKDIKKAIMDSKQKMLLKSGKHDGTVVYLGSDVEKLVKDAQYNLERKMKMNAIVTVVMVYAVAALTVPILSKIFGGG